MRLLLSALATALLVWIVPTSTYAQTGIGVLNVWLKARESADAPNDQKVTLYKRSKALVIGMDHYDGRSWPQLSNGIKDAEEVAKGLAAQGFDVTLKKDLKSDELDRTLKNFFVREGEDVNTRLLLWFSGHGYTIRDEGYIVPVDAPSPKADADIRDKAISLRRFGEYMREANSRHVLAIFDSCFSGAVFNVARSMPPPAITLATTEPVREFISSGEADQQVYDDGTFRKLFLDVLAGKEPDADANRDGYVTGTELGLFLHQKMTNLTYNRQTPRYGKLNALGYDRGDFVFQVGKPDVPTTAAVPTPQPIGEAAQAWAATQATTSQAVLKDFIRQFANTPYGSMARARIEELKKSDEAVVGECDRLARDDTLGIAGVRFEQIIPAQAVPACRGALAIRPDDPRISYQLGRALEKEGGGAADTEAARLFRKSADAGYRLGISGLGFMYAMGRGVAKDEVEAVRWFRKAVDAGDGRGMFNLGTMYRDGRGVAKDEVEAVRWFRKAADAGNAPGMTGVGEMYLNGRGVAKDEVEAMRWFRKAADAGFPEGMNNLGTMYRNGEGVSKDEAEAARWYRKAADAGNPRGMSALGYMYLNGRGVAQDDVEAMHWFRRAVDGGDTPAMANLGWMYENGKGVARDLRQAREWYERAVAGGFPQAKDGIERVSEMERQGKK